MKIIRNLLQKFQHIMQSALQKFKNFTLPLKIQSNFKGIITHNIPKIPVYQLHLLPQEYQIQANAIKSQLKLTNQSIKLMGCLKPQFISLLTYNVWFQSNNEENRYPCIISMLADADADIVCLQEVNSNFFAMLCNAIKSSTFKTEYYISFSKMHWYDVIILSKYPCKFYKIPFQNSSMSRSLLTCVIQFVQEKNQSSFKLGINCVHLQSLNNQKERINQLQAVQKFNLKMDMSIIAGDFNFSDNGNENKIIVQYTDIWKTGIRHFSKYSDEQMRQSGYTMPGTYRYPPWRPDHIIYKNQSKAKDSLNAKDQISIIGDFTIPPYQNLHYASISSDGIVKTPSDHFGLFAKIHL